MSRIVEELKDILLSDDEEVKDLALAAIFSDIERLERLVKEVDDFLSVWHIAADKIGYTEALRLYVKMEKDAYDDPAVSPVARERKEKIDRLERLVGLYRKYVFNCSMDEVAYIEDELRKIDGDEIKKLEEGNE